MPAEATWEIIGDDPPVRHALPPGAARVIGRHEGLGADLVVADLTVARRHASLVNRGGALEVQDLGSHCGVYVNDKLCHGVAPLSDGDEVRVGRVRLRVRRLGTGV